MNYKSADRDQIIEALRVECDNYAESVLAIKAMANILRWDQDAKQFHDKSAMRVGPRLRTSSANRVSPNKIVTPDLAVARDRRGHIVEAKVAMSPIPARRESRLLDLQKYDDELTGWPTATKTVDGHDILLLVHHTRAFDVITQLAALRDTGKFRMDRPFAVLGFVISEQRRTYLAIELKEGALDDAKLSLRLRRVVSVALDHLVDDPELALLKLYDADPPLPYLMHLVHETIVNSMNAQECDDLRDLGTVSRQVTITLLRSAMAERCGCPKQGEGVPEIPKSSWLVEALDAFVKMGWAENGVEGADYIYTVKHRRQIMEQFLAHAADLKIAELNKREQQEASRSTAPVLAVEWVAPPPGSELLEISEKVIER